jgi:glycosyltransferase involved in cell wall biosynthesis
MEAIQSIREQTDDGICCIVVDGGSTDGTEEYLQELNAEWLTPIIRERTHGVSNARNVGLEAASERYVMFLDSDDLLYPRAIEHLRETLKSRPKSCAGVFGSKKLISQNSRVVSREVPTGTIENPTLQNVQAIGGPSGAIFRRSALEDIGGFDESLPTRGDLDLYLRLLKRYSLFGTEQRCCVRRFHGDQLSREDELIEEGRSRLLAKHQDVLGEDT